MKNKLIKLTIWTATIVSMLTIILAIHIYLVTSPKETNPTAAWQLARIDIEEETPLSAAVAKEIKTTLKTIEGVERVVINSEDGNAVVGFNSTIKTGRDIYRQFSKQTSIAAKLYVPTKEQLAAGCPAIDKSSITYQVGSFFQEVFHNK